MPTVQQNADKLKSFAKLMKLIPKQRKLFFFPQWTMCSSSSHIKSTPRHTNALGSRPSKAELTKDTLQVISREYLPLCPKTHSKLKR